jgi:hypothetical protein
VVRLEVAVHQADHVVAHRVRRPREVERQREQEQQRAPSERLGE